SRRIAPGGGKQRVGGTTPPAWGVPPRGLRGDGQLKSGEADSVFLDIARSVVAGNRIDISRRRKEPMPFGWALDKEGQPTSDPASISEGSFAPIGDYKGSGMAI